MAPASGLQSDLIVTGDVIVDHHLYEGERAAPTIDHKRGVRAQPEWGGAAILGRLLEKTFSLANETAWKVHLGIKQTPPLDADPCSHHAFAVWQPFAIERPSPTAKKDEIKKVWRANLVMGYGHTEITTAPVPDCASHYSEPAAGLPPPRILVLDDAGFYFRHSIHRPCWCLPAPDAPLPEWIVLKMSPPLAQGDLWHAVTSDLRFADRLVGVVSAPELREECVGISCGLSWERTVEDVRDALLNNPALSPLCKCRHVVIRFSADGALWLDQSRRERPVATLVFDAAGAEAAWEERRDGHVFGYSVSMTAAIAFGLARITDPSKPIDLVPSVKAGLAALRDLLEIGHGRFGKDEPLPNGFPVDRLAAVIAAQPDRFASAPVVWPNGGEPIPAGDRPWMIVDAAQRPEGVTVSPPLIGLARQMVLRGKPAFSRYPCARFGDLTTIDRHEIETLRSLRRMMIAYEQSSRAAKPLCIGVFGPPGAGKSFGVKQISNEVFGKEAWLEFNLSQFNGPNDLIGAFHQVRDKVLSGITPVVFWDEFDSKSYDWLKYLLAPMQDGRFQEGQVSHWIGKCVFIFAGGTSRTYAEFVPPADTPEDQLRHYKLSKGPDFHSRLDAYYDVVGPNQRLMPRTTSRSGAAPRPDRTDVCFPLRRALLIRSFLKCADDERLDFDSDLLDALLLVPEYTHGARSLEKLVLALRPDGGGPIRRSSLPPPALLSMHVDAAAFAALLKRNDSFLMSKEVEHLAVALHEFWRKGSSASGSAADKPYDQLGPTEKENNRAAARRIPRLLSLVGLGLAKSRMFSSRDEPGADFLETYLGSHHLELLAEAEHDGWMEHLIANGWRSGHPRDNQRKIHPLLKPYSELDPAAQEIDRAAIRSIPEKVSDAGYRIVWLKG